MADDKFVDISQWVDRVTVTREPDDRTIVGLRNIGPITLTGRWLAFNERICYVCQEVFAFGPEGPYAVTECNRGITFEACPACTMALIMTKSSEP
jgi:hypothetical protein